MNYAHFLELCAEKGETPKSISRKIGIANGNTNSWRNGGNPSVDVILKLMRELNCTADELISPYYLDMAQKSKAQGISNYNPPEFRHYHWNFPEYTETDKMYNKVCYTIYALHGIAKGSALLSAIELPDDKTAEITKDQLFWLAYRSNTTYEFFVENDLIGVDSRTIKDTAISSAYYWVSSLDQIDHDKAIMWETNFACLYSSVIEKNIDQDFFTEFIDFFAKYKNKQVELKNYILQSMLKFEDDNKRKDEMRDKALQAMEEEQVMKKELA